MADMDITFKKQGRIRSMTMRIFRCPAKSAIFVLSRQKRQAQTKNMPCQHTPYARSRAYCAQANARKDWFGGPSARAQDI